MNSRKRRANTRRGSTAETATPEPIKPPAVLVDCAAPTGRTPSGAAYHVLIFDPAREDQQQSFSLSVAMTQRGASRAESAADLFAAVEVAVQDGDLVLEGYSSSNRVDAYGTYMSREALDGMAVQMVDGVPVVPAHWGGIMGWEPPSWQDQMGVTAWAAVEEIDLEDLPEGETVGLRLAVLLHLWGLHEGTTQLRARLERGQKIGTSIGGWFTKITVFMRQDDESVIDRVRVDEIKLDHDAITGRPANPDAWIEGFRERLVVRQAPQLAVSTREDWSARPFGDLPVFADTAEPWDADAAAEAILGEDPGDSEWERYADSHVIEDKDADPETKAAYKLPIAKPDDAGVLRVVHEAVSSAMGAINGARGGLAVPDDVRQAAYNHVSRYYEKWDEKPPEYQASRPSPSVVAATTTLDTSGPAGDSSSAGSGSVPLPAIPEDLDMTSTDLSALLGQHLTPIGVRLAALEDKLSVAPIVPTSPSVATVSEEVPGGAAKIAALEAEVKRLASLPLVPPARGHHIEPEPGRRETQPEAAWQDMLRAAQGGASPNVERFVTRDDVVALLGGTGWCDPGWLALNSELKGTQVARGGFRERSKHAMAQLIDAANRDGVPFATKAIFGARTIDAGYLPAGPERDALIARAATPTSYAGIVPVVLNRLLRLNVLSRLGPVSVLNWIEGDGGSDWTPPLDSEAATLGEYLALTATSGTEAAPSSSQAMKFPYRLGYARADVLDSLKARATAAVGDVVARVLQVKAIGFSKFLDQLGFNGDFAGTSTTDIRGLFRQLHQMETGATGYTADTTRLLSASTSATPAAVTEALMEQLLDLVAGREMAGDLLLFAREATARKLDALWLSRGRRNDMIELDGGFKVTSWGGHPIVRCTEMPAGTLAADGATYTNLTGAAGSVIAANKSQTEWRWLTQLALYEPASATSLSQTYEIKTDHALAINIPKYAAALIGLTE